MESLSHVDQLVIHTTLILIVLFFVFGIDDFFIDLYAWVFRIGPQAISDQEVLELSSKPEKTIAVLLAAWKEDDVLRSMIHGNVKAISYKNYHFFLGVYPNDHETVREAQKTSQELENVHVVINPLEGPTCKGQMLNVLCQEIINREKDLGLHFDAFVIHDAEDLIHPLEFTLVSDELERSDFIQVPVFSLPVSHAAWVAGVYIDEFTESHTKLVLVRNHMGAAIPSAGVGTSLSRGLVEKYIQMNGRLLNTNSLTEDYELGLSTKPNGLKSKFICKFLTRKKEDGSTQKEYIATREYFPKAFHASVRQKSRWTLGIAFQGWENIGWQGDTLDRYFLFRDRKGPFCNLLVAVAFACFFYSLSRASVRPDFLGRLAPNKTLLILVWLNLFFMLNRIWHRSIGVKKLYGWPMALMSPLRWPLANLIGLLATYAAFKQYLKGKISGTAPKWIKTSHELPPGFGIASPELSVVGTPEALPEVWVEGLPELPVHPPSEMFPVNLLRADPAASGIEPVPQSSAVRDERSLGKAFFEELPDEDSCNEKNQKLES